MNHSNSDEVEEALVDTIPQQEGAASGKPPSNSYGEILRSTSIIGGATAIGIIVGLVRTKAVALLLGPAGLGLIGLLQSLMGVAATVAGLGFRNVGTRQIAEAAAARDEQVVAAARRALSWGTAGLAVIGAIAVWFSRELLAIAVLADPTRSNQVGWLAIGVALTVAAGSQSALLTGFRRIGDIARISLASSLLSTLLGIAALWIWSENGIVAFVLISPATTLAVGHWYVSRMDTGRLAPSSIRSLLAQLGRMARLGTAFMISGIVTMSGELVVRTLISRELGPTALGEFQASWAVSMTYTGLVLTAMGTDYYPRLTAAIHDHIAINRLVNEQTEIALLLAGPLFLAIIGAAPWAIGILYSHEFREAAAILRVQALGDILKVAAWPVGFVILASGDGRTFLMVESLTMLTFIATVWLGLDQIGVIATGVGFLAMYAVSLALVVWQGRRRTGFLWSRRVTLHLSTLLGAGVVILLAAHTALWLGALTGAAGALISMAYALDRIGQLFHHGMRIGPIATIHGHVRHALRLFHK